MAMVSDLGTFTVGNETILVGDRVDLKWRAAE